MIVFQDKVNHLLQQKQSVSLRFLNEQEQTYLQNKKQVHLYGGYKEASRKRAYLFDNKEDNIIPIKIEYNHKYLTLTHQNILGTLLSLGLTLDSIGDILPKQGIVLITREISKEVFASFTAINNVPITCKIYNGTIYPEQDFAYYKTFVESVRLDLVISKLSGWSRKKASEMMDKEYIKVNHITCKNNTRLVSEGDIISIRKIGRFQIKNTQKRSKKGKIILNYAKYI